MKESRSIVWVVEVLFEVSLLFFRMDVGFEDVDAEVAYAGLFFITGKEAVDLFWLLDTFGGVIDLILALWQDYFSGVIVELVFCLFCIGIV